MKSDATATLTPKKTAEILGVGVNQLYAAIHAGKIPTIRFGRNFLIPARAIDRLLDGESARNDSAAT